MLNRGTKGREGASGTGGEGAVKRQRTEATRAANVKRQDDTIHHRRIQSWTEQMILELSKTS